MPKAKSTNTMKAFALCAKATLLVAFLFGVNPRLGFHHTGRLYASSCNFNSVATIGSGWVSDIGYAHFPFNNPFSGLAMSSFGC